PLKISIQSLFPEPSTYSEIMSSSISPPISLQSKEVSESTILSISQLSVELLLAIKLATSIVPFPLESSVTVKLKQSTIGAMLSSTVTLAVHEDTLPLLSVTVRVTELLPICEQSKEV